MVGSTVTLNGGPFQVVGVASPGFRSVVWGESPGPVCAAVHARSR